eukprot:TRINITY_DN48531_c0_g1_i1.p1 TRINITY_DN48531_c0_g1~~TRINITY_DN48531_c0_g1_i1.p1  ORF type:complete len:495 (+),score=27.38 TRINITY_DN48531_c0_g1_i1:195-1679(+)
MRRRVADVFLSTSPSDGALTARQQGAEYVGNFSKYVCLGALRWLQTKPAAFRHMLQFYRCWICLFLVWVLSLIAPPLALCKLPEGTIHPYPSALVLTRSSSFSGWHADSLMDAGYMIDMLLSTLPLAIDPREVMQNGSAILVRNAHGVSGFTLVEDSRALEVTTFLTVLDLDRNGFLDRAELWQLQGFVKSWFSNGREIAKRISALSRDAFGRVSIPDGERFWREELSQDYHSFVVMNGSLEVEENADEAAFHRTHDKLSFLVPVGRIEAVATTWYLPCVGDVVCAFASEPLRSFLELLYLTMINIGVLLLSDELMLAYNLTDRDNTSRGVRYLMVALLWAICNPVFNACIFLNISQEVGKLFVCLCMLSLQEFRRMLARMEYWVESGALDEYDVEEPDTENSFVRCPICRRLSQSGQVVRRVHGDIQRDTCCICLVNDSEVCFGCGHICVCSTCFDTLVERESAGEADEGWITVFGAPADNAPDEVRNDSESH